MRHVVAQILSLAGALSVLSAGEAGPRTPERDRWSWNTSAATVTATGDLAWAPEKFVYAPGKTVRFIDYATGDDGADGSKAKPWKHHPWDPAATGKAKDASGAATYVFKRGVVYRGELRPDEHGSEGAPIILTSDPAWGSGEAAIVGSEHVTGWTKGAANAAIPDAAQVWQVDVPFAPRSAWVVQGDKVERIALARTPNWTVTDPQDVKSGWWRFEQPEWWSGACKIDFAGHRAHIGVDTRNLTRDADYYVGATARVEYGIVMGTPYPITVEGYDANRKGIIFQGIWTGDSETITTGCRYFLEDKPHYLDSAGEFWFERNGDGGRLFARLPGDADPNKAQVEVARRCNLIEAGDLRHVTVSGLAFRFTNTHWDLGQPPWGHPDVNNAAIRVRGAADGLRIAGCSFAHVAKALRIDAGRYDVEGRSEQPFGSITFADNDISETDHGAIEMIAHGEGDVAVLRNRMREIGRRTFRQDHSHALCVSYPATMEVAGNILERCTGAGLFLWGGKGSGDQGDAPMSRHLVHHNKVVDSLLSANDWGGIETWQGGSFYLYSNISGNPGGRWWAHDPAKPASARLGFAYYHDGSFKNYDFNCVAYGLTTDWKSTDAAHAAFYEATPTIHNAIFNCTVSRFWVGSQWSPGGGRHFFLGNVFDEIGGEIFQHGQLKEDKGEKPAHYPHATTAYGSNVISRFTGDHFAVYESSGRGLADAKAMADSFADHPALAMDVGTVAAASPLMDPDKRDYRAKPGSAVVDKGVKLFVPWALARTVGEWQFRRNNAEPTRLLDDHWYMAPYYVERHNYHLCPVHDLTLIGSDADPKKAFVAGPLEDWTDGALVFDGKTTSASVAHATMVAPFTYDAGGGTTKTVQGAELATPDIGSSDLLIELYLQAKPGVAVLVTKMAGDGYALTLEASGGVALRVVAGGAKAELASKAKITDGKWHHVIAEIDRAAGTATIYTDGVRSAHGPMALAKEASLSNTGDLLVGRDADGHHFAGAIEYLRIARTTLAASQTSIEELYDWQFDGPFLRDFAGKEPKGKRDAGAFEAGAR